jgi:hypothetical protein
MKKSERRELARRRAFEMARSGEHHDWYEIEHALRNQGLDVARSVLDSPQTRKELDEICRIARDAKAAGRTYLEAIQAMVDKPSAPPQG